jgi:hypothetical protein
VFDAAATTTSTSATAEIRAAAWLTLRSLCARALRAPIASRGGDAARCVFVDVMARLLSDVCARDAAATTSIDHDRQVAELLGLWRLVASCVLRAPLQLAMRAALITVTRDVLSLLCTRRDGGDAHNDDGDATAVSVERVSPRVARTALKLLRRCVHVCMPRSCTFFTFADCCQRCPCQSLVRTSTHFSTGSARR